MGKSKGVGAGPAGTGLRASGKNGPQVIRSRGARWTDQAQERFLDVLGASCNVTLAAAAAGFSTEAIYARRRREPAFAAAWQAAVDHGYARIEAMLVQRAIEVLAGTAPDPDALFPNAPFPKMPFPNMSVRDAIAILQLHRAAVRGEGKRPGWRGRPRSLEEVRGSILTKLEAIDAARRSGRLP